MSSSFVGNPSIPSDKLLIDRSESSAETPSACKTLGQLFMVSNRLIASSIEFLSVLNAIAPIATNPKDAANFLTFPLALDDSSLTPLMPCSASLAPFPDLRPALSKRSRSLDAISTCLPSTDMSIFICPSAISRPPPHRHHLQAHIIPAILPFVPCILSSHPLTVPIV